MVEATQNPLEALDEMIAGAQLTRAARTEEEGSSRRSPVAPLEMIEQRVHGAKLLAKTAPPLLGVMGEIELARETLRGLSTGELEAGAGEEDPLGLWRAREEAGAAKPPVSSLEKGASPPPPPRAASVGVGPDHGEAPLGDAQVSQLLLDALATRPLSGDARARAASALANGIARNDVNALKAALAILVTGE